MPDQALVVCDLIKFNVMMFSISKVSVGHNLGTSLLFDLVSPLNRTATGQGSYPMFFVTLQI